MVASEIVINNGVIDVDRTKKNKKITPYQQELIDSLKKIQEFKDICEANVVSTFYLAPDELNNYDLTIDDFSNNIWKVYFAIVSDIYKLEKKPSIDDITVGLYLEKHLKLKKKYEEYGGYDIITRVSEYIQIENLGGYVEELKKWNAVIKIVKTLKVPVINRLSDFCDMTAEDIYNEYEALLNHIFVNVESDVKSYNACDGIHELIDKLNNGINVGLPLYNAKLVNKEISGLNLGQIYGIGGVTGSGKSTTLINWMLPSIIEYDEKMVLIINEEDETKVQRELIIWVANNVFKQELHKYVLRDGNFDKDTLELLRKCADWIEGKKSKRNITIIPLERYTTNTVIKIIKKYASMGVKYFCIDTLKESADTSSDKTWLEMTRDMVKLYDVIKPSAKNVCLVVTYQLGKIAAKQRYYTNNEVGMAKSITDVMSVNIMIRQPFEDEYEGGKNEIVGYKLEGKNGLTKIPFKINKDKKYLIIFIPKNRFGASNQYQIIAEYDLSLNKYKDLGICNVPQDF